jgi:hypothetical protein
MPGPRARALTALAVAGTTAAALLTSRPDGTAATASPQAAGVQRRDLPLHPGAHVPARLGAAERPRPLGDQLTDTEGAAPCDVASSRRSRPSPR